MNLLLGLTRLRINGMDGWFPDGLGFAIYHAEPGK
jgi:hypothetical protein